MCRLNHKSKENVFHGNPVSVYSVVFLYCVSLRCMKIIHIVAVNALEETLVDVRVV